MPTATFSAEDASRNAIETPVEKYGVTGEPSILNQAPVQNSQPAPAETSRPVPTVWQLGLAGVALLSALIMLLMRQASISRWQRK
jgi:hypothetical protein